MAFIINTIMLLILY